jgi:hypothetical protein
MRTYLEYTKVRGSENHLKWMLTWASWQAMMFGMSDSMAAVIKVDCWHWKVIGVAWCAPDYICCAWHANL